MQATLFRKRSRCEEDGIALLTTLLLLFLMSSLLVGFSVLLYSNQKLAGSNDQQVRAFYAAEAGMEQMTAGLGNLFDQTYSPSIGQIDALETTPPALPGISYTKGDGTPGYLITPQAVDGNGNPAPTITTISSGTYQGMTAMATTYTLMVNARTASGQEVTLKRTTQTVGIPMFQFGIWSDTDMDFFPGPNFNFGGRTHTNGNLFLASGSTLTLSDKTDAYKDVIRYELANGHPTSSGYTGTVNITVAPGGTTYRALGAGEGSILSGLGSAPVANTSWPTISMGAAPADYSGNLQNGQGSAAPKYAGGAKQLNLGIVTIGGGTTQQIDLIRRPVPGEAPNITGERYFAQASLRVLLSDNPADIMALPCIDGTTQPFNLSHIAQPVFTGAINNWNNFADSAALLTKMNANGVIPIPLAASGAALGQGGGWTQADGYLLPSGNPTISGYIKIEEQTAYGAPCGTWKDVTIEVLGYGYVGRNIDPVPQSLDGATFNPQWTAGYPATVTPLSYTNVPMNGGTPIEMGYQNGPTFPTTTPTTLPTGAFKTLNTLANQQAGSGFNCPDPHPLAIIRLERVRDNPSTVAVQTVNTNPPSLSTIGQVCGIEPSTGNLTLNPNTGVTWVPQPYDFWPNTLFDSREGTLRDTNMDGNALDTPPHPTINGVMHYIELDGNNLANWFAGALTNPYTGANLATSGPNTKDPVISPNDFAVYISDRRGNYANGAVTTAWPPLSSTRNETGEYGFNDLVNSPANPTTGCPNNVLDTGEDVDGTSTLYTYGANGNYIHAPGIGLGTLTFGQYGIFANLKSSGALTNPINCATTPAYSTTDSIWPFLLFANAGTARENPPLFFRRAVKIVNANKLTAVGACPDGVSCGLTIASENPVYIQGDFNANSAGNGWNDPSIATSVAGDAVTLLSAQWNDINSFNDPYDSQGGANDTRNGVTTWYRVAVIAGITVPFPQPNGGAQDYGTDGGVHNFLRYIESWGGTLEYQGSIIELFSSRQANGTFKCCNTVYSPPNRGYKFDTNFLNPTLLPPRTPLFRDVNTTGWTRLLLPGQYN